MNDRLNDLESKRDEYISKIVEEHRWLKLWFLKLNNPHTEESVKQCEETITDALIALDYDIQTLEKTSQEIKILKKEALY